MIAVLQRVSEARVRIDGKVVGEIGAGLLVLLCAERGDGEAESDRLLAKILKLRIFSDDAGKMNRSVQDLDGQGHSGGLLVVSQFTLAADASGHLFLGGSFFFAGTTLSPYIAQANLNGPAPVVTGILAWFVLDSAGSIVMPTWPSISRAGPPHSKAVVDLTGGR